MGIAALVLASRAPGAVQRRLSLLVPLTARRWRPVAGRDLVQSGLPFTQDAVVAGKIVAALAGALAVALAAAALPIGPMPVIAGAYGGFVVPSLLIEARARTRRERAEQRVGALVEWLEALVASGRPAEAAFASVAARGSGTPILDDALRTASAAYALGAPLFRAVAAAGEAEGLPLLASLAQHLERSRDLGRGTLIVLREQRDLLRDRERARALGAASRVEGRLMLVLVLCYLPALMLLVVVPLFASLLHGLDLTQSP